MELFQANAQWANRPEDERFQTIQQVYDVTKHYAESARESLVSFKDIRVENNNNEVQLIGKSDRPAKLTHWSFGQLCARVGAPASYLRELPATLAVQNLNHGLKGRGDDDANLLLHANGSFLLRALTSDKYARIWNWEVAERLLDMENTGLWTPAVPDIRAFRGAEPALYASDHDMFCFLRSTSRTIAEPGSDGALWRGVIVENSEVGASALKMTRFLYREMCGNHIIWGASQVCEISLRHVGSIRERFQQFQVTAKQWLDEGEAEEAGMITRAISTRIADTKEGVLDKLFGKRNHHGMSRKTLESAYDAVNIGQDGDPRTVWGFVQGVTRHSQTLKHTDERTSLDRAAGKVLRIDF